ncbi:hypothetical protein ATO6_02590 [Oceanicola sp. 22II-s10i]|uniref:rod-binding protein n=1 Tax=Oceanicola sp. 22II-s10i TaxID=1317116 RepID=UPI000B52845D|nr:rod-binding protein [Oceanicola sp. 22II-s10i]OWU85814.1 hypothetical protein ATO6_02590 [Oceanicola sp. 22II-s10i]
MLSATQIGVTQATRDPGSLKRVAMELEVVFIDEMLKSAGVGAPRGAFGGGPGEAQFASFLRQEQARAIAAKGIGLAERFEAGLRRRET